MCYCRSDSKPVYSREQLLGIANVLRARKQIPTLPPVVEAAARQACIYRCQGLRRRRRGGVGCRYTIPVVVGGMTPPFMKSICGQCGVNTSNLVPLPKCVGTDLSAVCAIPVAINYRPNVPGSPHCSQGFVRPIKLRFRENSQGFLYTFKMPAERKIKLIGFVTSSARMTFYILALTETWLHPGNHDATVLASLVPPGYSIRHQACESGYGGVAVVHKDNVAIAPLDIATYTTFECLDLSVRTNPSTSLSVIYRPPPSPKNVLTFNKFIDEFTAFLETKILQRGLLLIGGDFNTHVDNPNDWNGQMFSDLLEALCLKQHIVGPTHKSGHTVGLLITREHDDHIGGINVFDYCLSDHHTISLQLEASKPPTIEKEIVYCKLNSIDRDQLKSDIGNLTHLQKPTEDIDQLAEAHNSVLSTIIDKYAPLLKKRVTVRPVTEWFNDSIANA